MKKVWLLLLALLIVGCGKKPPDARVTKLGEQLRRMKSDTNVGINLEQYGNALRDLNFAVEEVVNAKVGSEFLHKEAQEAVGCYKDAGTLWSAKIATLQDSWSFVTPGLADTGTKIWQPADLNLDEMDDVEAVNVIVITRTLFEGKEDASLESGIQELWRRAGEHTNRATRDINGEAQPDPSPSKVPTPEAPPPISASTPEAVEATPTPSKQDIAEKAKKRQCFHRDKSGNRDCTAAQTIGILCDKHQVVAGPDPMTDPKRTDLEQCAHGGYNGENRCTNWVTDLDSYTSYCQVHQITY